MGPTATFVSKRRLSGSLAISFNLLLIYLSMEIREETSLGLSLHIGHDFGHDHLRVSDLHGLKLHRR